MSMSLYVVVIAGRADTGSCKSFMYIDSACIFLMKSYLCVPEPIQDFSYKYG